MKEDDLRSNRIAIIGGGFAGLAVAYELARSGHRVTVLEAENCVGGLASAFQTEGERLERFYHHWFTNDRAVMELINELGLSDDVVTNPTNTSLYFNTNFFRLSTPLDLLKFTALPFWDRVRLGILTLRARATRNWTKLEDKTAEEWLRQLGGDRVFNLVWKPLLNGKFGPYAKDISAVWFWNKLKLRGGSRGKGGEERLAYLKGSFSRLAEALSKSIEEHEGRILLNHRVDHVYQHNGQWQLEANGQAVQADIVVATPALPLIADMIENWASEEYLSELRRINYLANVCLVLQLEHSLSKTYWLNVNDPSFPYVGLIEHTNFESPGSYGGDHIVYLSKYLPHTDALYTMNSEELLEYSIPHIQRMFPEFSKKWIRQHHVWKARWAQPVVEKNYSRLIPKDAGPKPGFHICSMAQIYPEDRGTNYAIESGRNLARKIMSGHHQKP